MISPMQETSATTTALSFEDILAEGRALAEQRAKQGIAAPIAHRARTSWVRALYAAITEAWSETRQRWGRP